MHLAIDASNIREGGGVTHLSQLLRTVEPREMGITKVTVWASQATLLQLPSKPWLIKFSSQWTEGGLIRRLAGQQLDLRRQISRLGCDVLFSPGGTIPLLMHIPVVTMSQNMLPFEPKESIKFGRLSWMRLKMWLLRHSQVQSFKKANGVIFLTHYAREVVNRWVVNPIGMQALIPHGIESRFIAVRDTSHSPRQYSYDRPFTFLYVSALMPYKHQVEVAIAVNEMRRSGFPLRILFIGADWGYYGQVFRKLLQQLDPHGKYLIWPGGIPFSFMHREYKAADGFIFASSCENLPNILIEAMASGLPIACSSRGPMPEVLQNAGVYFDPMKINEISNALKTIFSNYDLRCRLATRAKELSSEYSWEKCAEETFKFIVAVAKRCNEDKLMQR